MIEVTVHDVMLRAPKGNEEAEWLPSRGKYKLGLTRVILLKEQAGERILPIWVGGVEGDAIAMCLVGISRRPRPMTFEMTAQLLALAKMKLEKVAVTSLRERTYYATLWVKVRNRVHEVDARPSDAINLAMLLKAPILVTPEVLETNQTLLTPDAVIAGLEAIHRKGVEEKRTLPEEVEMEWRSFRSLPRGDAWGSLKRAEEVRV